jgi:dTDP-4-dehydrorhamnose reductase
MQKIAVIGASGQIGHHLMVQAARRGHQVVGTWHSHPMTRLQKLDLADADATLQFVRSVKPGVVICAAAWPHVDGCETDPEKGRQLNVINTMNAAQAAKEAGARFVWYSSDYVFSGDGPIYDETSEANPLSVYGKLKLEAERAILALDSRSLVIRSAVVYGPSQQRKNTIYQLVRAHIEDKPFQVALDQICNPTYAPNLAAATIELIERGTEGILHVAGSESMSRYDFAMMACMILKLNEGILEPVMTEDLDRPAPRPLLNALDVSRAQGLLRCRLMGCAEGLSAFQMEAPPLAALLEEKEGDRVSGGRGLPSRTRRTLAPKQN